MPIAGPPLDVPADLPGLLRHGLARAPGAVALASHDERLTWLELEQASARVARHLVDMGLRRGDRVASLMPNRPALIALYLACMKAGFAATPLNYRYQPPEIDHALAVSDASILIAHAERLDGLAPSREVPRLRFGTITYGGEPGAGVRLEDLLEAEPPAFDLPLPEPDDPAFVFFTSGSTGPPKGVTHTHRTFGWVAASIAGAFGISDEDVVLAGSSLSHIGSSKLAFGSLWSGARVAIARTSDGDELLSLFREERPTVALILPAALFALVRDHDARNEDFRSLRFIMSGGDRVPAELEEEFTAIVGTEIHEGYGMTEIGTSHINPPSGPNKIGSVGTNNPTYLSSIRDESGAEVPVDTEGRHWVSGPAVMRGYWGDLAATGSTIVDGWLDTGDILKVDADGYLWFRGRKKQIIVHDSSNINPEDVEDAISSHPAVAYVGVVGVHDTIHGENVWAYITLRDGAERPTSQDVIRFARDRVGYKAPEVIVVLDEMPLTATGKVDRESLKRMAADRVGAHPPG